MERSRTRRGTRLASSLGVALLATMLPVPVQAAAADRAPAAVAASSGSTRVTLLMSGCEGCLVQPRQHLATAGEPTAWARLRKAWSAPAAPVRNGRVSFTVPRSRTEGMTFAVTTPWEPTTTRAPRYVVIQYPHFTVGRAVTQGYARAQMAGTACWKGTRKRSATLQVTVRRMVVDSARLWQPGDVWRWQDAAPLVLIYADPTLATTGGFSDAPDGQARSESGWVCPAIRLHDRLPDSSGMGD